MSSRKHIALLAIFLSLVGIFVTYYKVEVLGIPLLAHDKRAVYSIDARISFSGKDKAAQLSLALPNKQEGINILSQDATSADFGFTKAQTALTQRAEWSKRSVHDKQRLFYSLHVIIDKYANTSSNEQSNSTITKRFNNDVEEETLFDYSSPTLDAAKTLLRDVYEHSSDAHSFTALLIQKFNTLEPSQTVKMLLSQNDDNRFRIFYRLLRYQGLHVRKIRGLYLQDEQQNHTLISMLEVHNGTSWQLFDLTKGKVSRAENFFIWQRGGIALLESYGVKDPKVSFSVNKHFVPADQVSRHEKLLKETPLMNFSLFSLPISQQNSFKHILLIPIGALVIVILRVLVGLRTSGTFMPILIALAFMQTSLIIGVLMFIVIVSFGLIIRSYLSQLNLLLVARIAAVLIVVITLMSILSIFSYKLGLDEVLNITFFPMIILAWTIERMSILWEEEGSVEVFKQASGSLFAAILSYFAMSNAFIGHITYNFPELLLVVLAAILSIGTYSGYRLSELIRFKSLG